MVPAGYYLKAPGQAAPCPKGEWKSGTGSNGNCTKCAYGVTTEFEASVSEDNCTRTCLAGRRVGKLAVPCCVICMHAVMILIMGSGSG